MGGGASPVDLGAAGWQRTGFSGAFSILLFPRPIHVPVVCCEGSGQPPVTVPGSTGPDHSLSGAPKPVSRLGCEGILMWFASTTLSPPMPDLN